MSDDLILPPYNEIADFEGQGNWAIKKYYQFPFRYFYRHKLKMIVDLIGNDTYYNILDLGSGPGIFTPELKKHCIRLKSIDRLEDVDIKWKFDAVVCASFLEFVNLEATMFYLSQVTKKVLYVASPMDSWVTRFYFKLIGDKHDRNDHREIKYAISRYFKIREFNTWNKMYFSLKATPKY